MPTPPDYLGISRLQNKSPGLLYGSTNLPDKSNFGSFLYSWVIPKSKTLRVSKCMLWFLAEFSSIFHPACHGWLQNLGGPGSIMREVRCGVDFFAGWGGGGGGGGEGVFGTEGKSPDFR